MWLSAPTTEGDNSTLQNTTQTTATGTQNITYIKQDTISKDEQLRFLLPEMALLVVVVASNFIVLCVIYKSRIWSQGQNSFIIHLVVIHLLRACFFLAMDFYYLSITVPAPLACKLWAAFSVFFTSADAHAVSLMFFDRLLFISSPSTHRTRMTRTVAALLCSYNILQGFLISMVPQIFSWLNYEFIPYIGACTSSTTSDIVFLLFLTTWVSVLPFLTTTLCFARTFYLTKKRSSQVHILTPSLRCLNPAIVMELSLQATFKILCMIYFIFVASWIPYYIVNIIYTFTGSHHSEAAYYVTQTLTLTSGAINPWLYGMYNRRFRKTLKSVLFCINENVGHGINHQPPPSDTRSGRNAIQPNTSEVVPVEPFTITLNTSMPRHREQFTLEQPRGRSESLIGLYNYPMDIRPPRRPRRSVHFHNPPLPDPKTKRLHRSLKESKPKPRLQATCSRRPSLFAPLRLDTIRLSISN